MPSVPASEFQKNFGEWHDKAFNGPIEITKYGRPTAYLVSAQMFRQMWQRFRISVPVEQLSDSDISAILKSTIETDSAYNLSDIPELDEPVEKPASKSR